LAAFPREASPSDPPRPRRPPCSRVAMRSPRPPAAESSVLGAQKKDRSLPVPAACGLRAARRHGWHTAAATGTLLVSLVNCIRRAAFADTAWTHGAVDNCLTL